jgi:hypothetical protein
MHVSGELGRTAADCTVIHSMKFGTMTQYWKVARVELLMAHHGSMFCL